MAVVCKLKNKHRINERENNEKQKLFNRNTTHNRKDNKLSHNKQQTKTWHVITYEQKQKHKTPDTNNQKLRTHNCTEWEFRLYYKKNNGTNDVAIACKLKIQSSYWQKENNDKSKFFNGKHNTRQTYGNITHNKWQTNILNVTRYNQNAKQDPQIQTIKHYEQVTVQNENPNKTTK